MTYSRQEIVKVLHRAGMDEIAAAALATLPEHVDYKAADKSAPLIIWPLGSWWTGWAAVRKRPPRATTSSLSVLGRVLVGGSGPGSRVSSWAASVLCGGAAATVAVTAPTRGGHGRSRVLLPLSPPGLDPACS